MNDWKEMLPDFGQPLSDAEEIKRLELLLNAADKQIQKVESDQAKSQLEGAQGRVNFIDKLAIGAGATIAATVSFLGTHSATLHPHWVLRSSLIFLVLTMLMGFFRNFCYPNYVMQIHKISYIRCSIHRQQCGLKYLIANPATVDIHTGYPFNRSKEIEKAIESEAVAKTLLTVQEKIGEHLLKQWLYAQNLCLTFAFLSIVSLVWLALCNF